MAIQTPLVLISGAFSSLPPGDTIPASDPVAQASGNAALVLANTALASGNAGISTGLTAQASGNAGISTGLTALASGNAGLVSASNKVPISGGTMTGVLAVTSGTDALPSITFTGDLNTGIYSPGADQVAVATNGSQKLIVLSNGNVGIGTSAPGSILHCVGSKDATNFTIGAPLNTVGGGAFSNYSQVTFENTSGANSNAAIRAYGNIWDSAGSALSLMTSSVGAPVDRLYINSSGSVGIGTTGPDAKLHIIGGVSFTGGEANLAVTSSTTASVPATISSLNSDATLQIFAGGLGSGGSRGGQIDLKGGAAATDAGTILFRTGTGTGGTSQTEKARIDASGRLLVGTSTWSGSSSNAGGIQITSSNHVSGGQVTERLGRWRAGASDGNGACEVGIDFFRMPRGGGIQSGSEIRFFTGFTYLGDTYQRMTIDQNGTITFNAYGAGTLSTNASGVISASDGRYKTKTRQIENGLEAITALEPTYYRWNEGSPFESEHEELGFFAQEVAAVIPEASPGEDEEGKYRNYHDRAIIAMLVKGMQEQQSIITALTARVAALEAN